MYSSVNIDISIYIYEGGHRVLTYNTDSRRKAYFAHDDRMKFGGDCVSASKQMTLDSSTDC